MTLSLVSSVVAQSIAEIRAERVPLVSVVMITYKEKRSRLARAIDSILQQTMTDFEFLVLFESDDENFDFVQTTYVDPRLRLIRLERRKGRRGRLAAHNQGMSLARGRYVARMDGDDVAYPDKLCLQIDFMSSHPDVGVLGTAGRLIDAEGRPIGVRRFPTDHRTLVKGFSITNPIFHSAVLIDRKKTGYDLRYKEHYCDDLELWLRLLSQGVRFANLPDVLIDYTQPGRYTRPLADWRGNFRVRLAHWRLVLRYPLLITGILGFGLISIMPQEFANWLTARSWISDRIRSIRGGGDAKGRA